MNKKICICAGLFVAAMFLLTLVPVNAIGGEDQQTPMHSYQQGYRYQDEQYIFPPQLPPGTSSLSCITKRRALDPWHMCVFDVGFSVWSMRLRDGPAHWLNFPAMITVVWHKGQAPENILDPISDGWHDYVVGGFDIVREQSYFFNNQPFYTATVHGLIYKDMYGLIDPEYKSRDLVGYNYYLENGLLQAPMTLEQLIMEGFPQA